jgi:cell division protein FtsZ
MIQFDLPKDKSSILKVIGVGGGGSNAISYMYSLNIEGVDFVIANTDAQALMKSKVPNKIHLGPTLTEGLGAGANPDMGRRATEESLDELRRLLEINTKMVFITVGMGGGTGTGGAPVIAKMCRDMGILTVGIVTTPFEFEGPQREAQAQEGIKLLKEHVDTMLVISNDKVRQQFGNLRVSQAFSKADNVLSTAAKCITDIINCVGDVNTDFADVKTVMQNGGVAILGSAIETGENRASLAIENALNSPLLNDNDISGAKHILLNINSGGGDAETTMDELNLISTHLRLQSGVGTNVILGTGIDETLGEALSVTIIATGFNTKDPFAKVMPIQEEVQKVYVPLQTNNFAAEQVVAPIADATTKQTFSLNAVFEEAAPKEIFTFVADETPTEVEAAIAAPVAATEIEKVEEEFTAPIMESMNLDFEEAMTLTIKGDNTQVVNNNWDDSVQLNHQQKVEEVTDRISSYFIPKPVSIYDVNAVANNTATASVAPLNEVKPVQQNTAPIELQINTPAPIQSNAVVLTEQEELLKLEADKRTAMLRNLNYYSGDINDEYDNVPAYKRQNVDISSSKGPEAFYSTNASLKADENNNVHVSTMNKFTNGVNPD